MEEWGRAMELRERVDDLLRPRGLTFLQWRVIHVTGLLMRETGDMVSQLDIRRRAFLSAGTASKQMFALAARGWLDYGPDYYGVAYRICTTDKAALMLAETRPLVVSLADRA